MIAPSSPSICSLRSSLNNFLVSFSFNIICGNISFPPNEPIEYSLSDALLRRSILVYNILPVKFIPAPVRWQQIPFSRSQYIACTLGCIFYQVQEHPPHPVPGSKATHQHPFLSFTLLRSSSESLCFREKISLYNHPSSAASAGRKENTSCASETRDCVSLLVSVSLQTYRLCQSQAAAAEEGSLFLQDELRACRGRERGRKGEGTWL